MKRFMEYTEKFFLQLHNEFNKKIESLNKNISVVICITLVTCIKYYKIIIKEHLTKK